MKDEAESDEEKEEPQPKKARTRPKLCEPGGGSEWVILGSLDQHNLPSRVFNKKKGLPMFYLCSMCETATLVVIL